MRLSQDNLTTEQVMQILSEYRPDLTAEQWKTSELLTVLKWLLPAEWKKARNEGDPNETT